jgi:hypothetical protein
MQTNFSVSLRSRQGPACPAKQSLSGSSLFGLGGFGSLLGFDNFMAITVATEVGFI